MSNYTYDFIKIIDGIKPQIRQKIDVLSQDFESLKISKKADKTIVTEFDLFISDLFKNALRNEYPNINFYSEEDLGMFEFPIAIIDPIDGTREFAMGMDECVISFGVYFSDDLKDSRNFSWIYNPINNFEVDSFHLKSSVTALEKAEYHSFVSRTEYEEGLHKDSNKLKYKPIGSIAYKLGLLSTGKCDFVISKKDKNVWDILAGTHICSLNGINLFKSGKIITLIQKEKYRANLVWSTNEFFKKFKNEILE